MKKHLLILLVFIGIPVLAGNIDRKNVVTRHNVVTRSTLPYSPAQVGNGKFAFGMDITGLQSFVPFSTLSDWSWHSFPLPEGKTPEDYKPVMVESYGKSIPYLNFNPQEEEISKWLKANPHRFNLGRVGFVLMKNDGTVASEADLAYAKQHIDLWTGIVSSSFELEGREVRVRTSCHPQADMIGVKVESPLLAEGRLYVFIEFPYADEREFCKHVGNYEAPERHSSSFRKTGPDGVALNHTLDSTSYDVLVNWSGDACFAEEKAHRYVLKPSGTDKFEFSCNFVQPGSEAARSVSADEIEKAGAAAWESYWESGAAVDFSGVKDSRWMELERRVVLSQYLMRINECGLLPPQESGLVNNGWYGRFHWEMIWWHVAHYGLWDRWDCFDSYLGVYNDFRAEAEARAASEGRKGARWPKCTGNFNREWPCQAHAFLCWQQPHPIYFAEMEYRANPSEAVLDKWKDIVVLTADYMADCVFWDRKKHKYVIGPPTVPVSENTDPYTTLNPIFELSYFRYGLRTALYWADRLGLPEKRVAQWRNVYSKLAPLPVENGFYVTCEGMSDMWTKYNFEHPALTGVYGWLPGDGVDIDTFRRTFYNVLDKWQMNKIWGWDYPMLAMAAARMGDREKAVELLLTTAHKFSFDVHGFADVWPFPYFPANGGLLTAIAMMCGGWDGSKGRAPGFPKEWKIKYEGFNKMQ